MDITKLSESSIGGGSQPHRYLLQKGGLIMKVVILAGGFGTRISEESHLKPKPMIEIGGQPILWHIMKLYSYYGLNDFIICCGYKQHVIKEYFANYYLHRSDITFDFSANNRMIVHSNISEPWKVTIVDTGLNTMTGGRLKRIQRFVENEPFMLTYGDGVSDINLKELLEFHRKNKKIGTISTYNISQRFGVIETDGDNNVKSFREKSASDGSLINIGYMVFEPQIFTYIDGDETILEREPLQWLARDGQLDSYTHKGFWQCMDTKRDMDLLNHNWQSGEALWKIWE